MSRGTPSRSRYQVELDGVKRRVSPSLVSGILAAALLLAFAQSCSVSSRWLPECPSGTGASPISRICTISAASM